MGGTYKSKRFVGSLPQNYDWSYPNPLGPFRSLDPSFDHSFSCGTTQETTSYRSRGRFGDLEITPTNTAGFIEQQRESGFIESPGYDIGHEFDTVKVSRVAGLFPDKSITSQDNNYGFVRYSNPRFPVSYSLDGVTRDIYADPDTSFITTNDVADGNAAISAVAPTRPVSTFTEFSGELLQQLPSVIGASLLRDRFVDNFAEFLSYGPRYFERRAGRPVRGLIKASKSGSDEYLNVQFGWLPFVSDLKKMVRALLNASSILDQFSKDSGKLVRRRYTFPPITRSLLLQGADIVSHSSQPFFLSYDKDGNAGYTSGGINSPSVSGGSILVSVNAQRNRWFSGGFTYFLPKAGQGLPSDLTRFVDLADKLLGVELTPEVIWELAPWSWLVDWILGVQSNISAATRFYQDGLVLRYGYLMVKDHVDVSCTSDVSYINAAGVPSKTTSISRYTMDRKRRVRSTPYGFGLNPTSDFSDFQWSILAALGMTRAPRTLR